MAPAGPPGWSSPVETTAYISDLDKLDHPGRPEVGSVLAPTQGPLERAASPILAPVPRLRARACQFQWPPPAPPGSATPVLAPTQAPLERPGSPILAPVPRLRTRAARSNGPRRT